VIEDLRDPDGVLRGIKRKREEREERMLEEEQAGSLQTEGGKSVLDKLKERVEGIERTLLDMGGLSSRTESLGPKPPTPASTTAETTVSPKNTKTSTETRTGPVSDPAIAILRHQVTRLTAELSAMKEREKAIHDQIWGKLDGVIEQVSRHPF
jgi:hypothetical protein